MKNMSEIEQALNAVDNAINALSAIGDDKRTLAMVRKLTVVKADLIGKVEKEKVLETLPKRKRRNDTL